MKRIKRFGSIALAFIMLVSMTIPAFAANYDIDTSKSVSLTIHKNEILKENHNTDCWAEDLISGTGSESDSNNLPGDATDLSGITFTITLLEIINVNGDTSDTDNYRTASPMLSMSGITAADGTITFDDDAYQAYLADLQLSDPVTYQGIVDAYGDTRLPQGVYYVKETMVPGVQAQAENFYVSLPMTDSTTNSSWLYDVHCYPKNVLHQDDLDFEKTVQDGTEWVDEKSVENGETVTWRIESGIPANIKNAQSYEITDNFNDHRLSYVPDSNDLSAVDVYYYDASQVQQSLVLGTDYTITWENGDPSAKTFTVSLTKDGMAKLHNALLEFNQTTLTDNMISLYVEFQTKVTITDETDLGEIVNDADQYYFDQFSKTHTNEDDANVYTCGIKLIKKNGKTSVTLQGVNFILYRNSSVGGATIKEYYSTNPSGDIVWTQDLNEAKTLTTTRTGLILINGLADDTYYMTETQTLRGYNLLTQDIEIAVARSNSGTSVSPIYSYQIEKTVLNYAGFTLPLTGGAGTLMLTIGGLVLCLTGATLFIISKRRNARKNNG